MALAILSQYNVLMSYFYISRFKMSDSWLDNDKRLFLLQESFSSSRKSGWNQECNQTIRRYFERAYLNEKLIIKGYVSECSVFPTGEILIEAFVLQKIKSWQTPTDFLYIIYLEKKGDQYIEKGLYKRVNP